MIIFRHMVSSSKFQRILRVVLTSVTIIATHGHLEVISTLPPESSDWPESFHIPFIFSIDLHRLSRLFCLPGQGVVGGTVR